MGIGIDKALLASGGIQRNVTPLIRPVICPRPHLQALHRQRGKLRGNNYDVPTSAKTQCCAFATKNVRVLESISFHQGVCSEFIEAGGGVMSGTDRLPWKGEQIAITSRK